MRTNFDRDWDQRSKEALEGLKEWRLSHPRATLKEIEMATDQRLDRLRSQLIADTATASDCADWESASETGQPSCPSCQVGLKPRGVRKRELQSQGPASITLNRQYGVCPACNAGLFPPG